MSDLYDAKHIRDFYDAYGDREWGRLEADTAARVSFHIHCAYLREYVSAGDHVLEAGAGPGRFTIELARMGARVTVGDISPAQLELNRVKVAEAGCEAAVVSRDVLDIADLSRYDDDTFDAVVCYGGPLSYVFERADNAVGEMLRVVRPGGHILLSVMSLVGTTRRFLSGVLALAREHGLDAINQVNTTGDLRDPRLSPNGHYCHMFRWSELAALLRRHPCEIMAASASNFLALGHEEALEPLPVNPELWEAFLAWELAFCREPGALDGGTHILAVLRQTHLS